MTKKENGESGAKPVDASTARRRQDALGRRLRQMYDDVTREPVPDEFLDFLKEADKQAPKQKVERTAETGSGERPSKPPPAGK